MSEPITRKLSFDVQVNTWDSQVPNEYRFTAAVRGICGTLSVAKTEDLAIRGAMKLARTIILEMYNKGGM